MKKIAFTLYMISLLIMFPLYVFLEFNRNSKYHEFSPLSMRDEKVKTTGIEVIRNING